MPKLGVPIVRPHEGNGEAGKRPSFAQRLAAQQQPDEVLIGPDSPVPGNRSGEPSGVANQIRRSVAGDATNVVSAVERFLTDYIVVPPTTALVAAAWVAAAWQAEIWDRFPHLAVTSPEKRCGKTRLLQLLAMVAPNATNTTNISPAAIYRLVALRRPTLLLDEAQSITRRGSESSEILRELLNAGIDRDAKVIRVGGEGHDQIQEFEVYSPKVVALIGDLDGVLADRCLPIYLRRKMPDEDVLPFRSRLVDPTGRELHDRLAAWVDEHADRVAKVYDTLDVFPIANDRLAELLLPLQAVLRIADESRLDELAEYAKVLDAKDAETETPGIRLLIACRQVFGRVKPDKHGARFLATTALIDRLTWRTEEPWHRWTRGGPITPEALANLLRPFHIRSQRNAGQTARGYFAHDFTEAWARYLLPPKKPANPANSVRPTPG